MRLPKDENENTKEYFYHKVKHKETLLPQKSTFCRKTNEICEKKAY